VSEIRKVNSGGALDFGGSEFQEASTILVEPEKKTSDEPYGWWKLGPGNYLMKFNEKIGLTTHGVVIILPHSRLLTAGGSHPPLAIEIPDDEIKVLLSVGNEGLAIKENARVSKVLLLVARS
jgi:hypothetical protein